MSILQELLSECIRSPEELRYQLHLTDQEVAELTHIADQYPICIPPYYLNLIGDMCEFGYFLVGQAEFVSEFLW